MNKNLELADLFTIIISIRIIIMIPEFHDAQELLLEIAATY